NSEHLKEPPDAEHHQALESGDGHYGAEGNEQLAGVDGMADEIVGTVGLQPPVRGAEAKAPAEVQQSPEPEDGAGDLEHRYARMAVTRERQEAHRESADEGQEGVESVALAHGVPPHGEQHERRAEEG